MKISQCMSRDLRVATLDNSLQSAAQIMSEIDCGFVPVADEDRLVGVITDRDIAIRGVARGLQPGAPVSEAMSEEILYCFEEDEADDVLGNMGDLQLRRMPVLDREKRLVGIVSITDLATHGEAAAAGAALGEIARPSDVHSQHQ